MKQYILSAILFGCMLSALYAQEPSSGPKLDEHELDALRNDRSKWWAEVQRLIRDDKNHSTQMQTALYLLSRSFVWVEEDPRDSETRSAIGQLAAEVREAIKPALEEVPDDSLILSSDVYRRELLEALALRPEIFEANNPRVQIPSTEKVVESPPFIKWWTVGIGVIITALAVFCCRFKARKNSCS